MSRLVALTKQGSAERHRQSRDKYRVCARLLKSMTTSDEDDYNNNDERNILTFLEDFRYSAVTQHSRPQF